MVSIIKSFHQNSEATATNRQLSIFNLQFFFFGSGLSGLGDGCGFFKETCGIMTGAACLISCYAGKRSDGEVESEKLLPMLQDLGDWFQAQIGNKYTGTRCEDIVGDLVGTPEGKQICGGVLFQTFEKVNEILQDYDFV
jgi:hypothetical protein